MFKIIDLQHPSTRKSGAEILTAAGLLGLDADYLGAGDRFVKVGGEAIKIDELDCYIQTLQYDPDQQPVDDDMI